MPDKFNIEQGINADRLKFCSISAKKREEFVNVART
jgi:hypothetical protein